GPHADRRAWRCGRRRTWRARLRTVSSAAVHIATPNSAPDDHLAPGPCCRVEFSASGRAGAAGTCPTVGAGFISPAGVQKAAVALSAPEDHFTSGPDCRVSLSGRRRVVDAGACPTIGAGIVSTTGVQIDAGISAPDDHFAARPDCRGKEPAN